MYVEKIMIPVFRPLIEKEEFDAAHDSLELGWLGMGSYVNEFEKSGRLPALQQSARCPVV